MQRILVVEDDWEMNQGICYVLKENGYTSVPPFDRSGKGGSEWKALPGDTDGIPDPEGISFHKGQLLTYSILLDRLWDGGSQFVDRHALAVNVNRLRGKIEDREHKYISNVYGMGYQWIGQ